MSRETLSLPRRMEGRRYKSEGVTWLVEKFTGEVFIVRCEGGPMNSPHAEGDRQRLAYLPKDREWL